MTTKWDYYVEQDAEMRAEHKARMLEHWRDISLTTIHALRGTKLPLDVDVEGLADKCVAAAKSAKRGYVIDDVSAVLEKARAK